MTQQAQHQEQESPPPEQDPSYVDEGIFTVGDNAPAELAYGEAAWAVNPYPMEPIRNVEQPRQIWSRPGTGMGVQVDEYAVPARPNMLLATPGLLDYAEIGDLGIDIESERWKKISHILVYHTVNGYRREGSLSANMKAAKLIQEWLTDAEQKQLRTQHKVIIPSRKYKRRSYVVHEDPIQKVEVWEGPKIKARCCGVIEESGFVQGDQFLAKVMAIKTDEDDYVKRSYVTPEPG